MGDASCFAPITTMNPPRSPPRSKVYRKGEEEENSDLAPCLPNPTSFSTCIRYSRFGLMKGEEEEEKKAREGRKKERGMRKYIGYSYYQSKK